MHYVAVEILPINPFEAEVIIVPLYEQLIEEIQPDSENAPCTLAQALWLYAAEDASRLLTILDKDESACEFIMGFEESWFVLAEGDRSNRNGHYRATADAVKMARTIHVARMAQRAVDDCSSK